uniref:Uncharacterized protein n=1 Tax=Romanomermis culicivorax TaxID=13658 RepID=A0A915HTR8_ROMCU
MTHAILPYLQTSFQKYYKLKTEERRNTKEKTRHKFKKWKGQRKTSKNDKNHRKDEKTTIRLKER